MSDLKIKLFGEFRAWRGEDPIEGEECGRQKTRSLLKLLLTRPGSTFSRDEILEALWPDASPEVANRSLWVIVNLLRRVFQRTPGYGFDGRATIGWEPRNSWALRRTSSRDKGGCTRWT